MSRPARDVTPAIARAAGWDAGDKAMRAAGRTEWNHDDWDAACATTDRLMQLVQVADPVLAEDTPATEAAP